jgi:CheY-like chemotaxis protein
MATRILIIDDDTAVRESITDVLESAEYQVDQARNGLEGLERARTFHPDVIVVDLMMPVMDGLEFRAALGRDPDLARIPVLFVTAADPAGRTSEVDPVLRKPFGLEPLLTAVRQCLARSSWHEG